MQRVLLSALLILVLAGLAGLVVLTPPDEPETTLAEGQPAAPGGSVETGPATGSGANVAAGAAEEAESAPGDTASSGTPAGEAVAGGGTTVVPQGLDSGSSAAAPAGPSPSTGDIAGAVPAPADPGAPTFDVVRVEPSGEALIAGVAEPNAEIEVLSNGEVVAEVTADTSGAFIAMPTSPLEPGEHRLTLRRAGDTSAEPAQKVAVVVPQDGGGVASVAPIAPAEPQITAAPDALAEPQIAAAADAPAEPQVAAAPDALVSAAAPESGPTPDAGAPTFGAVNVKPGGEAVIVGVAEPNAEVEVLSDGAVVAEAQADSAGAFTATPALPLEPGEHVLTLRRAGDASAEPQQELAVVVPDDGGVASVAPAVPAGPQVAAAPEAPTSADVPGPVASLDSGAPASAPTDGAAADGAGAAASNASAPEAGTAPGAPAPAAAEPDAPATAQEQAIASAGPTAGPESATGETEAGEAGEMIASAPPPSTDGTGATSAEPAVGASPDQASPDQASPDQASPGQIATDQSGPESSGELAAAPSDAAPPATPGETPLSVAAAEAEGSSVYVAGQAEPGSSIRVFANEDLLGETQVNASGNWMLEAQGAIPVGRVAIRADQTAGQNVVSRTVTPFVRYPGYTPLIPEAGAAAGSAASLDTATDIPIPANVIIRSGDNLWTISRRTYGYGIRYKSIYSANTDQISNPDLIYPGQVFLLPTQREGAAAAPTLTQ